MVSCKLYIRSTITTRGLVKCMVEDCHLRVYFLPLPHKSSVPFILQILKSLVFLTHPFPHRSQLFNLLIATLLSRNTNCSLTLVLISVTSVTCMALLKGGMIWWHWDIMYCRVLLSFLEYIFTLAESTSWILAFTYSTSAFCV